MNSGDAEPSETPGFRFSPTEEEIIGFYLKNKLEKKREEAIARVIPVVDIYRFDPWQLPEESCNKKGRQWFFFCPRQEREVHGGRPARTTPSGYWKATGSPGPVYSSSGRETCRVLGERKTMVFYTGRAPSGTRTNWKMHEYRAIDEDAAGLSSGTSATRLRRELSLCRVYSGTLRSFDRRPPAVGEASSSSLNIVNPALPQGGSSDNNNEDAKGGGGGGGGEGEGAFDWDSMLDMEWGPLDWD